MKIARGSIPVLILCIAAGVAYSQVNGWEETIGGIPVIHAYGSNYEMGYALGYLDGDRAMYALEEKMIPDVGGPAAWQALRDQFDLYFSVPLRIEEIADGIVAGAGDRPDSILFSQVLGRYTDNTDFYVAHSIFDLLPLLYMEGDRRCSSLSSWGTATMSDPVLLGDPALIHNNDGSYDSILIEVPSIIALDPDDGNQTVLYSWTLALGCTNGMNEHGLCIMENAGNYPIVTNYSSPFVPQDYSNTVALLEDDFNGSGTNDLEDILDGITNCNRSSSNIIHVAGPVGLAYSGEPCIVVEINNAAGFAFRYDSDDPLLDPDHLAATNHHRVLYSPSQGWRYTLLQDSISADPAMTLDRLWNMMVCCNQPGASWTSLTVCVQPETRMTGIAYADYDEEAFEKEPVWISWSELFPPEGIELQSSGNGIALNPVEPNPNSGSASVGFFLEEEATVSIRVFDISGRIVQELGQTDYSAGYHSVQLDGYSAGIYFCRMTAGSFTATQRFVVIM